MERARAGQGAEDRAPQADLHRRPRPGLHPRLGALELSDPLTRDAVRARLTALLRGEAGVVVCTRLCPRCGSSEHGAPHARDADGAPVHVSFSYTDGLAAVAWSRSGPLGVDVERVGATRDAVGPEELAAWTAAEARAKASGNGLTAPLPRTPLRLVSLALPAGFVGTLACSHDGGPGGVEVRFDVEASRQAR